MNLVLFDIDGTILHARNAGTGSFFAALEEVLDARGVAPEREVIEDVGGTKVFELWRMPGCRGARPT